MQIQEAKKKSQISNEISILIKSTEKNTVKIIRKADLQNQRNLLIKIQIFLFQ